MRKCIICGKLTEGSVGAAGYKWPMICQPCKDLEDNILAAKILADKVLADRVSIPVKLWHRRGGSPGAASAPAE